MSLSRKYFEIVPINNIDSFSPDAGVDIINFLIPPVAGASLPTSDLVIKGNLEVYSNNTNGTTYSNGSNVGAAIDNVAGMQGAISRVDITSRQGNSLLEQRQFYSLISKVKRGILSNDDLGVGKYGVQQLVGENASNTKWKLMREANADEGTPFAMPIDVGLFTTNNQQLNLSATGGLEIKIFLNSTKQFLMNLDTGSANKLDNNFSYRLTNVSLFGRYNFLTAPALKSLTGVSFKQISNTINTIQSSNDTTALIPQVQSLDKIIYIYQPNDDTLNNFDSDGISTDQLVGLEQYGVSNNGTRFPYSFDIKSNPSLGSLAQATVSSNKHRTTGDSEVARHFITALNGSYPPQHSLVSGLNQERSLADLYGINGTGGNQTNLFSNYVMGVATSYQYGFAGYDTPMPNNLVQLEQESQVGTANAVVPTNISGQTQSQNALMVYNTMLSYSGMNVAK